MTMSSERIDVSLLGRYINGNRSSSDAVYSRPACSSFRHVCMALLQTLRSVPILRRRLDEAATDVASPL